MDTVGRNSKGETIMPYHVFKALRVERVMGSLLPSKSYKSRRQRRIDNGTIKEGA